MYKKGKIEKLQEMLFLYFDNLGNGLEWLRSGLLISRMVQHSSNITFVQFILCALKKLRNLEETLRTHTIDTQNDLDGTQWWVQQEKRQSKLTQSDFQCNTPGKPSNSWWKGQSYRHGPCVCGFLEWRGVETVGEHIFKEQHEEAL
jgi:hypothetical protein